MVEKGLQILVRLKQQQSFRKISKEMHVRRKTVREVSVLAKKHHWLDPDTSLPNMQELISKTQQAFPEIGKPHVLKPYHDKIKEWEKEGLSAVVICDLLKKECSCDVQAIRRYIRKNFPNIPDPVMIRTAVPGEVMEVDFGFLGFFLDEERILRKTWIFSGRLRYSRKAFRKIVFHQKMDVFFLCHILAFEFFRGVPVQVCLDNLKAGVIKSTIDNEKIQTSYQDLARHYQFIIDPCLPYTPEHKGGVESDMKYVKNNFLPFFKASQKEKGQELTIADLEKALEKWGDEVADIHIIQKVGRSPRELFQEEQKLLKPLPLLRWEQTTWAECTVHKEWRINFQSAYYSVPYEYIGKKVLVCATESFVKIFYSHQEIALHQKASKKWEYVRKKEHAPPDKETVLQCSRQGLLCMAEEIGPFTKKVVQTLLEDKKINKLKPIRYILRLSLKYSEDRLEKACQRACYYKTFSYVSISRILRENLEDKIMEEKGKILEIKNYRFFRGFNEYGNNLEKNTFEEILKKKHPFSSHGNGMAKTCSQMIQMDQLCQEIEKAGRD